MQEQKKETKGYNILLTGGSGFLGSFIIRELLEGSSPLPMKSLTVLDRNPMMNNADERIRFIRADIRDRNKLAEACRGADVVIHSAAIVDWGTKSRQEILSVNYEGTRTVVEACIEAGVGA